MNKILSMFCVILVFGFTGTALAGPAEKVEVCHNGSIYAGLPSDPYNPDMWVSGSFVIRISENAVDKHVDKHGDLTTFTIGDDVITEVSVSDTTITGTETQPSCE